MDLVRRLPEQGASVILISHNLEEVMQICDRAVVMRSGRIVGEAPPIPENHNFLVSLIVGGVVAGEVRAAEGSAHA
jgi:ABC-type sugar transport system ATPase subunit